MEWASSTSATKNVVRVLRLAPVLRLPWLVPIAEIRVETFSRCPALPALSQFAGLTDARPSLAGPSHVGTSGHDVEASERAAILPR